MSNTNPDCKTVAPTTSGMPYAYHSPDSVGPYWNTSEYSAYMDQRIGHSRNSSRTTNSQMLTSPQMLTPPTIIELPTWEESPHSVCEADNEATNYSNQRT